MIRKLLLVAVAASLAVMGLVLAFREDSLPVDVDGRPVRFSQMAPELLDLRAERDVEKLKRLVGHAIRLQQRLESSGALFERPSEKGLTADERAEALSLYEAVLDTTIALDTLARFHLDFFHVNPLDDKERHARHFALFFTSYVEKLAIGLALVDRTINKPQFEKLFDEGNPGLGIAPGSYRTLKWNVVHVEDVVTALAAHQWMKLLKGKLDAMSAREPQGWGFVVSRLEDRYSTVREKLLKKSVKLFGGNTVDIGKDTAHTVWFPVQAEAAEVMGDTRVKRRHESLITESQALEMVKKSEPGDILVERRNWYLSNVGLPGFWPHAALYLGSKEELTAYFADPDVEKAYGKPFAQALAETFPKAWMEFGTADHEGDVIRVLEAMSEGVVFTSAEHSIGTADYVANMRPRRSKLEKARALERAFSYAGRPYDFDFDFFTDSSLVCSELVFKAWEPRSDLQGIAFPLEKVMGRMTLGPNTMVRIFDDEFGTPRQQMDFAWFLDGHEAARNATFSTLEDFRRSHTRPKWDVAQK